ncbi:MAG: RNA polymerase sigma factor [Planctomycetota bacterium]|nr:RNA polymerase sigma factor [Planctomycetota bacterium]MEC9047771.1 RNA polymerase sigma factor [Planctomycetota bacterium]
MTARIDQADFTDEDLVRQLQAGATELAMTELERRYGKRIHHFVLGMIRDPHLANDVTQEVFEKLLLKNNLYRLGTNFRAWLFEVARNQALTMLRSSKRLPRPVSALQVPGQDADTILDSVPAPADDEALVEAEFMTAFQQAVEDLPERYRTVFELCVRRGCAYQEAGRRLGIPTGTVAIRIMRARKRLFSALQHHLGRLRRPPACFQ